MTQLTINVENEAILPHLKKILNALEGVSLGNVRKCGQSSLDKSIAEAKAGKTKLFKSVDDFISDLCD